MDNTANLVISFDDEYRIRVLDSERVLHTTTLLESSNNFVASMFLLLQKYVYS